MDQFFFRRKRTPVKKEKIRKLNSKITQRKGRYWKKKK
jgi:hypothetical protein